MSFCCAGTRPSRRSAHTRRMYVGSRRMRSTTSPMSFGARMRLANADIPLREPCPKRAQRLRKGRLSICGPERDRLLRLARGHAPKLDGRRRLRRDPLDLFKSRADILGRNGPLVRRQHENGGRAPRGKTGQVHDRRRHECPVRHDDLTTIVGPELSRTKRDLLDRAGVTGHLDAVADPEWTLNEDPYAGKEVLEDVLGREPDDDAHDAE